MYDGIHIGRNLSGQDKPVQKQSTLIFGLSNYAWTAYLCWFSPELRGEANVAPGDLTLYKQSIAHAARAVAIII